MGTPDPGSGSASGPAERRRGLLRMSGRDPHEAHRQATPLELFFDLTLVVAFGAASDELAHLLGEGVVVGAAIGFLMVMFAIVWAWLNYSWFASAYDTDDWGFRLLTMVQMVGVLIVALGVPAFLASIADAETPDNAVVIAGYVVMRVSMVALWVRAGIEDPERRVTCFRFARLIAIAQVGWVGTGMIAARFDVEIALAIALIAFEMLIPVVGSRGRGVIPWHPHHLAERFGLLAIIALGEGILGTTAAVSAASHESGWSADTIVVAVAGVVAIFGMWWAYFSVPAAAILAVRRDRSLLYGYGHIPLYASIAAVGAGLHVSALYLEGHTVLSELGTVLTLAVPLSVYVVLAFIGYGALVHAFDAFHLVLIAAFGVIVGAGVVLAAAGAPLPIALLVVALAPWSWVVGYETIGRRHMKEHLARLAP